MYKLFQAPGLWTVHSLLPTVTILSTPQVKFSSSPVGSAIIIWLIQNKMGKSICINSRRCTILKTYQSQQGCPAWILGWNESTNCCNYPHYWTPKVFCVTQPRSYHGSTAAQKRPSTKCAIKTIQKKKYLNPTETILSMERYPQQVNAWLIQKNKEEKLEHEMCFFMQ